ncbi:efflux transporter, RND family, MFP subunit [Treponema primitia ZAS-2]|uniref:Efflux transporter, RND family, MFP subunit n=1 Tax=Treponema primitia (strain ATCC BAA-887 / DSM 12427 / ZAS-2) TaxID=545694 RepID=F5YQ70_TREPZ|nr:efflux RND transporter periplasmic adaptor subunit [Treponema primitia]AEF85233.1 efflux transporter, RND family, MFP subunit [Treponema primitia ZAS-2]
MKKNKKKVILAIIILILLCGGGLFFFLRKGHSTTGKGEAVYTVQEEMFRNVIEIAGNIEAAQQQNIQAAGDGTVEAVFVKEGDKVRAGQIFFQLDDSQERYNLASHDFQMNQERISGASGRLALMDKQREVLLKKIEDRRLEARFDGVIGKLTLAQGDYAKAQDIFGYLIDRSYLKATVEVVETDAARLKAGQRVRLVFPSYPDMRVEGLVLSYPAVGRITSRGATVLDTQIRIDNPPEEILPGYSFTGEIFGGEEERILTVEAAAIAYENGRSYVERIVSPENSERVTVEVIPYGRNMVKILSGLEGGDQLKGQAKAEGFSSPRRGRGMSVRVGR